MVLFLAGVACKDVRQLPADAGASNGTGGKGGVDGGSSKDGPVDHVTQGGTGGGAGAPSGGSGAGGTATGGAGGTGAGGTGGPSGTGAGAPGGGGGTCSMTGDCGTACNPGKYSCSTGAVTCAQTLADPGTTCGTGKVCDGKGACVACAAGGSCGTTCKPGTFDCSTGAQTCNQKNASPGTPCGSGQVCDGNGSCVTCTMGGMCGSECNPGTFDCSTGAGLCTGQKMKAPGTACTTAGMVCDPTGQCIACKEASDCGTTCKPGKVSCGTGAVVCSASNAKGGTACGQNKVCDGGGNCIDCTPNAACGDTCKPGTISCTTGTPVCNTTNAAAGKDCGSGNVCDGSGTCGPKIGNGGTCQSSLQCQSGNCSTGGGKSLCCPTQQKSCGTCVDTQTDNGNCGTCGHTCPLEQKCSLGNCVCTGYTLSCGGCGSWNFDVANDFEGWTAIDGTINLTSSSTMKHDGPFSMAASIKALADDSTIAGGGVSVPLCGNINLSGFTISAWIYLATTTTPMPPRYLTFNDFPADGTPVNWGPNQWVRFQTQNLQNASELNIKFTALGGFVGTMYVDTVSITGP